MEIKLKSLNSKYVFIGLVTFFFVVLSGNYLFFYSGTSNSLKLKSVNDNGSSILDSIKMGYYTFTSSDSVVIKEIVKSLKTGIIAEPSSSPTEESLAGTIIKTGTLILSILTLLFSLFTFFSSLSLKKADDIKDALLKVQIDLRNQISALKEEFENGIECEKNKLMETMEFEKAKLLKTKEEAYISLSALENSIKKSFIENLGTYQEMFAIILEFTVTSGIIVGEDLYRTFDLWRIESANQAAMYFYARGQVSNIPYLRKALERYQSFEKLPQFSEERQRILSIIRNLEAAIAKIEAQMATSSVSKG
ncbi:MAG: hypothetical protein HYV28_15145 [Ignavibacteriales bacterium]|nr:hypothetical protein [Ignavibacteriales bacterium]